jgi:hypothetical protein
MLKALWGQTINTDMTRTTNPRQKQSKSLLNYIETSGGFIDRNTPLAKEPEPVVVDRPVLTIAKKDAVAESVEQPDPLLIEQVAPEPMVEAVPASAPVVHEHQAVENLAEKMQELIDALHATVAEQQNTQIELTNLIGKLFESVAKHSKAVDQRFEAVNTMLESTSQTLLETTEKLAAVSTREINIPAPVVNVSLPEQKKIIKTVDRDSNGLIRQITEETEPAVNK